MTCFKVMKLSSIEFGMSSFSKGKIVGETEFPSRPCTLATTCRFPGNSVCMSSHGHVGIFMSSFSKAIDKI